jgi:hypothetical protein
MAIMPQHSSRHQKRFYRWLYITGAIVVVVLVIVWIGIQAHRNTHKPVADQAGPPVTRLSLNLGQTFPWQYKPYALDGQRHPVQRGNRATIVVMMASWCKFCAYDDKYVWPVLAKTPGVTVDIIDVSPNAGIGNPGPFSPPFSGTDHIGNPINRAGMIAVMREYRAQFHLTQPNVAVYVDHQGLARWPIKYFPTVVFINQKGVISKISNGGLQLSQAEDLLQATF